MLIGLFAKSMPVLVSLAIVAFFWGVVKFLANAGDEKAIEEGKQVMVWGLVGIFVLVSLWAIVGFIQQSLGLSATGAFGGSSVGVPTTIPTP